MVDAGMLEDVLWHIHNWFERGAIEVRGCAIEGGSLPALISSKLLEGQWYRISGSYLNDGLHQHPDTSMSDETFDGELTLLAIPKPLLRVVEEIQEWQEANGKAVDGPYASESFGGYSYTLKSSATSQNGSGGLTGWREAFRDRLNAFRKIS